MLLVIAAVHAGTLLGYTLGSPAPAGSSCISYGMGSGSCGPAVVSWAGLELVGVQADTCWGVVTKVQVIRAEGSEAAAMAAAEKLREAMVALGWQLPAKAQPLGKMAVWNAPPVDGVTASVFAAPGMRPDQWSANASLRMGDGVCREPSTGR